MRSEDVISKIELICNLPLTEDALVHFGDLMFPFRMRESVSARRKHFAAYVTPPTTVGQFNQISVLVCKEKTDKCVWKDLRQRLLKVIVALNYFSVRLYNVSSSDVVHIENVISKVQFIFDDFSAQATFDELGDGVDADGVVDGAAEHKVAIASVTVRPSLWQLTSINDVTR